MAILDWLLVLWLLLHSVNKMTFNWLVFLLFAVLMILCWAAWISSLQRCEIKFSFNFHSVIFFSQYNFISFTSIIQLNLLMFEKYVADLLKIALPQFDLIEMSNPVEMSNS